MGAYGVNMKIEAVLERDGLDQDYLVRVTHSDLLRMGAKTFLPGEEITLLAHINALESHVRSLNYALRALKDSGA